MDRGKERDKEGEGGRGTLMKLLTKRKAVMAFSSDVALLKRVLHCVCIYGYIRININIVTWKWIFSCGFGVLCVLCGVCG